MATKKKPADRTPKPTMKIKKYATRIDPEGVFDPESGTVKRTVKTVPSEPFFPPESPEPPNKRPSAFYNEPYLRERGRWEDGIVFEQTAENLFRVVKTLGMNLDAKVMDVGCGRGFIVRWLRHLGFKNAHGVEYGDTAVVHSACGADRIDLTKPLSFCTGCCDFAYCLNALDGVPGECVPSALREIHRVLAPGGHLLTQLLAESTAVRNGWRKAFHDAGWEERIDLEPLLISLGYNRSPEQWMAIWKRT